MDPAALGRYLRESRENKELTLEDAVRALRIPRNMLESFERGEFMVGDSPVRVRGMLRNYARYLGLEEDRVLQYFEAAHDKRRKGRLFQREAHIEPIAPKHITDTPPALPAVVIPTTGRITSFLRNMAMVLVSVAAIAVIGFVISNMLAEGEVTLEPSATAGTFTITPTNTPSITPRATEPSQTPDRLALGLVSIQVVLQMEQRSWVRVRVDGQDVYTGILEPNLVQTYEGSNLIEILAANAAALRVTYNGSEESNFGERGQQVELRFSPTGMESSLATSIPLPTEITPETSQELIEPSATNSEVQLLISPSPASAAGVITPTPLFPIAANASPEAATANSNTAVQVQTNNTSAIVPTATVFAPPATPTNSAVLPIRATPADATATKQG